MSERATILHDSPWQGVIYLTGGGAEFITEQLKTPGASRTVLEIMVPYSEAALTDLLQFKPDQFCSDATARAIAMAAFQRARSLGADQPFGLGCTASLATDRPKRGEHRAYIAVQTQDTTYALHVQLAGDRHSQENELCDALWSAASECLNLKLDSSTITAASRRRIKAPNHWQSLMLGKADKHATQTHDGALLFPGSFNPLHQAHRRMMEMAEELTGLAGAYELSIVNVDKPMLDYAELETRLQQFNRPVWLTRLATFREKARHFRQAHFVVGADTLLRIIDSRYYRDDNARESALSELVAQQVTFIVFGRSLGTTYQGLSDIDVPPSLAGRCIEITRDAFHEPVSSTDLRQRGPT